MMEFHPLLPHVHQNSSVFPWYVFVPLVFAIIGFIGVYIISDIQLHELGFYYLSVYGLFITMHYILQFTCALLNRRRVEMLPDLVSYPGVALNVAGYREDAEFYENCLESLKHVTYPTIAKRIIVIDGCDEDDQYMADICCKVFADCQVVTLPTIFTSATRSALLRNYSEAFEHNTLCIMQPHTGKRAAIRTAVELCNHFRIPFFVNTDSDTVLNEACVCEMMKCMQSSKRVAAVAGALEIFNAHETLLARLSHARYWLAFNIERAAQSYWTCLQCISGPLGLYRTSDYMTILNEWYNQTFCGYPSNSGDDRHATSCLLAKSKKILYTHLATASTETPLLYGRWLQQQTRWNKSYYRELGYLICRVVPVQNFFLTYEVVFGLFYPLALIVSLYLLFLHRLTWHSLAMLGAGLFVPPFMRSLVCIVTMEKRWDLLLMVLYGPLYLTSLLPSKAYAVLTIFDFGWGTSNRNNGINKRTCNCSGLIMTVLAFNILMFCALFHNHQLDN